MAIRILAVNRYGGKSISDLSIAISGGDFSVLRSWIDDFFVQNKDSEFIPGTMNHRTMMVSKKLRDLIDPLNDKPEHYLDFP